MTTASPNSHTPKFAYEREPVQDHHYRDIPDLEDVPDTDYVPPINGLTVTTLDDLKRRLNTDSIDLSQGEIAKVMERERMLVYLGGGGEGFAYAFREMDSKTGLYQTKVLKTFYDPSVDQAQEEADQLPINRYGKILRSLAANGRFAERISNRPGVLALMNQRGDQLEAEGYYSSNYDRFAEGLSTVHDIDTKKHLTTYCDWLEYYLDEFTNIEGDQYEDALDAIDELRNGLYEDMKDARGMADYFNLLLEVTNEVFEDYNVKANLPKKAFPRIESFGVFPDSITNPRFRNRAYIVMEYAPHSLGNELIAASKKMASTNMPQVTLSGDFGRQMRERYLMNTYFPEKRFEDVEILLQILHTFNVVFCDPTPENFAVSTGRETIFLDPSSCTRRGAQQVIMTMDFLTREEQEDALTGHLVADPDRDLDILDEIKRLYKHGFAEMISSYELRRQEATRAKTRSFIAIYGGPDQTKK